MKPSSLGQEIVMQGKRKVASWSLGLALSLLLAPAATAAGGIQSDFPNGRFFKGRVNYQLTKAEHLMMDRKYAEAQEIFKAMIKRDPENVDAISGLAMTLAMQFKLDAADEQFQKVLSLDPRNALAHTGSAMVILNRLQSSSQTVIDNRDTMLTRAEGEARLAIENDPQLQHAHYTLGMILKEQGKTAEAYQAFQSAVEADPQYSPGYAGLGLIDLSENRLADASLNFRRAINLNTGNSTAHYGLGEVLLREGQADAAIKELNTALYQFRNSAPVHLALGKAYELQGNTNAALRSYEKAALIKPELKEAYARQAALHVAMGQKCAQQGNTVGALKEFKQAVLIDPYQAEPYLAMATLRENRGDLELAVSEMRSGLELNPNQAVLRQRIADNLLKLEKLDDAIKEYQTTLTQQPGNSQAVDGLTRALYLKAQKASQGAFVFSNDYEAAKESLTKAIQLHPDDIKLRLAEAKIRSLSGEPVDLSKVGKPANDAERIAYAEALLAQNQFVASAEEMRNVIAHTNQPDQLISVADLALMIKDFDSAKSAYTKASTMPGMSERSKRGLALVSRGQEEARRNATLGKDLARRNQLPSSVDSFRQALAGNPRMPAARLGLADAEVRLAPNEPEMLRDAAVQYKAYIDLEQNLPVKRRTQLTKKIEKLQLKATKIERKRNLAGR